MREDTLRASISDAIEPLARAGFPPKGRTSVKTLKRRFPASTHRMEPPSQAAARQARRFERVARVMKEIPYSSPKRGRPVRLIGQARLADFDEPIRSFHLAEHRLSVQERSVDLKFNHGDFASKEAIKAHVSWKTEEDSLRYLARAAEAHLSYNCDFGQSLAWQLTSMEAAGEPVRRMGLESTDYSMAVGSKIKQKDGEQRYGVMFYDPGATTRHARVASDSLSTFEPLSLKRFIVKDFLQNHAEATSFHWRRPPQSTRRVCHVGSRDERR